MIFIDFNFIIANLLILLAFCHKTSSNSIETQNYHKLFSINSQSVSKAIYDVIHEFFINQNIKFDFIIYGEKSNHITDVVDEVTKKVNNEIPLTLEHITNIQDWKHKLKQSTVVFIKSIENLKNFHQNSKETEEISAEIKHFGSERLKFLVYVEDIKNVEQYFNVLVDQGFEHTSSIGQLQFHGFFIYVNRINKKVSLYVHQIYGLKLCRRFTLTILNSMNMNSEKWDKTLENFDHYENFHGCMVNFIVHYGFQFHSIGVSKNIDLDKIELHAGVISEIIQIMSNKYNFTPQYSYANVIDLKIKLIYSRNYRPYSHNIFLFTVAPIVIYDEVKYLPQSFSTVNFMFHISYNDLYTNYEKITMPFDDLTWFLMFITFGLTFASIFGLKFCPKWIKMIIFGRGVNNLAYNALGIFFGVSQLRLPKESFPRSILIIFIWFCLIIRTCWQSMMFEFMTSDMRKPLPASIEDLIKMNYTVLIDQFKLKYYYKLLNGRESPNLMLMNISIFLKLYKQALDGETKSKFAFFTNDFEQMNWKTLFKDSLPIMENEIFSNPLAIASALNNILEYQLNNLVDHLIPSGILNYQVDYGMWYLNRPIHVEPEDPRRILSMSDLEFGFVIFLGSFALPIGVFICELHALYLRRLLRKFLGLYEFLKVLKERLKDYHDKW
ncbi:hypothetical protein PVAND_001054 [Polypedilum vanderplanki]|uniref:Ionotropic receptor n=1 Tax=Polypedilum vanderplanki TaxID=319348 RepID=A0A9J6BM66_POLVA|nr:hypothetical protein PVAND_001054 [Polypedilum vanderplanki]